MTFLDQPLECGQTYVSPQFSDDDWSDLLDFIEQGKVLPVVGEGAITFGDNDTPLHPTLAVKLAQSLKVPVTSGGASPTISDTAQLYLRRGGDRNRLYSRLHRILQENALTPGPTLRKLADIDAFKLYLSTTCDSLFEKALTENRKRNCASAGFYPGAPEKDLPRRATQLDGPIVYHLLGQSSVVAGEFVAWEEDLLDFLSELPRHLASDTMRNLSADLRSHAILAIGLRFSDWVLRLLLRIARQETLSRVTPYSWFAEGSSDVIPESAALFFSSVSCSIQVIECTTPSTFVDELHRRWRERFPTPSPNGQLPCPTPTIGPLQSRGLVFVSYAREDEVAARRIEAALRQHGCAVYFDRERLAAGMNFDHELEAQVSQQCAIFLSVISPHTESAVGDHYFYRERNWAAKRLDAFAAVDQAKFYLPVFVHDTMPEELKREPSAVRKFQWTHCPNGAVTDQFAARVAQLQRELGERL